MPFPSPKAFGNVVAVRLKRLTKNGRINSSTATDSRGVSLTRNASNMAQLYSPFVQAAVGAVPIAGPPMQAAISGLLAILQAIDRRGQNKADLDDLEIRLHQLSCHLLNAPPACDSREQLRRNSLHTGRDLSPTDRAAPTWSRIYIRHTSDHRMLQSNRSLPGRFSSQMQNQHDMREVLASQQRQREDIQKVLMMVMIRPEQPSMGLPATVALGCVTLVDATGHEHSISVNLCTSFQQLNNMLQVLFQRDSIEARIQKRYLEGGLYDLCIDKGTEVTQLTSHGWSSIEAGTKIVMRVIIEQLTTSSKSRVLYKCHFCHAENDVGLGPIERSFERQAGCSIDCRVCKRRFQVSRVPRSAMQRTRSSDIDSIDTIDTEMRLIRNFHVQQTVCYLETSMAMFS
ncbi:uncharacterized protein EDB91DRAFT_1250434 [Suillus paluster]|uniref:uncharacterized protein n=1 Tax=Suillus paluster TaxID=48578 RepID=UPI001B8867E7|nr:uncharacterized protein EDB91DRAFT_1250434 [Suillus paluster]KAG1735599.1 hypothetical protein EDB91DRAFT_1250434 [Suillus paluster]